MKIVVTGGAGFIGSHLIDRLLQYDFEIINIDNLDDYYDISKKRNNILRHQKSKKYSFFDVDIRDKETLSSIIDNDVQMIVHLAAKAGVRPSIINPIAYQEVNVTGTQNLLEEAREKKINRFIFASSSSVYGNNPNYPWKEDDAVLLPISPYASTKVSGELLGHVYSHLYGISFLALRFFTVYGPRQRPDLVIHKFLKLMSQGNEIPVFGNGSSLRDYTYIDDIVDGIIKALNYNETLYEVINLGNNKTIKLNELIEILEMISGIKTQKKYLPEQPGDVKQTWADISKAQKLLSYSPKTSIMDGISNLYTWLKYDI